MLDTVARDRTAMAEVAGMKNLEVWYSRLEIESVPEELAPLVHNLHLGNRHLGDAGVLERAALVVRELAKWWVALES